MAYLTEMTTRIFHFPYRDFERKKKSLLSSLTVDVLLAANAKQATIIRFEPGDIKGSFTPLIRRSLIARKNVTTAYITGYVRQVPCEAIPILKTMGRKGSG